MLVGAADADGALDDRTCDGAGVGVGVTVGEGASIMSGSQSSLPPVQTHPPAMGTQRLICWGARAALLRDAGPSQKS